MTTHPFERLPAGFFKVSVVLNEAELRQLRKNTWLMPHGTYSEAIRVAMGRPSSPYGLFAAMRREAQHPQTQNES